MTNSLNFPAAGVFALLAACTTGGSTNPSSADAAAIQAAETFVVRHGFTDIAHPKDQPVENVALFDLLAANPDELLEKRYNKLQPKAFGFGKMARSSYYYVLFRATEDPSEIWGISVVDGQATGVLHALPRDYEKNWRPVPPNSALQRAGSP